MTTTDRTELVVVAIADTAASTMGLAHEFIVRFGSNAHFIIALTEHSPIPSVASMFGRVRYIQPPRDWCGAMPTPTVRCVGSSGAITAPRQGSSGWSALMSWTR